MMATKILAPNIWGWLAAVTGQRMRIIRWGAFLSFVIFMLVFIDQSFWWLALVITLYSFFWNAVLAQFEVVTLAHLGSRYQRYSLIRVWGSIGFIVTVLALGWVFDFIKLNYLLPVLLFLLFGLWLSSLFVADKAVASARLAPGKPFIALLRQPSVLLFFVVCFLMQVSHGPYYSFFSVFLEDHGYSRSATGLLWMLGVLAEVLVFLFMHKLLEVFSLRQVMLVSIVLSVIRWFLTAFYIDTLPILLFAQCLHAASFGSFHAFAVEVVRRWFQHGGQGQGMAFYSGVCFGGGGALGAVISGWIWTIDPASAFLFAMLVCVLAGYLALRIRF
jgi:PPP family 3-phenylpropionic acid transporter